MNNTPNS